MEIISEHACFGGTQGFYQHASVEIGLPMRFSVFQPPQAKVGLVPVLFFLAGLTCTGETFMIKAGAQRYAAQHHAGDAPYQPARYWYRRRGRELGFRQWCWLLSGCDASAVVAAFQNVFLYFA